MTYLRNVVWFCFVFELFFSSFKKKKKDFHNFNSQSFLFPCISTITILSIREVAFHNSLYSLPLIKLAGLYSHAKNLLTIGFTICIIIFFKKLKKCEPPGWCIG